jgi:hypothetical protein
MIGSVATYLQNANIALQMVGNALSGPAVLEAEH